MKQTIILASGSEIRATLLRNAGLEFDTVKPTVDEASIRDALISEGADARDIADCLAEAKARKIARKHPSALVIGSDQILAHGDRILSKPESPDQAIAHLTELSGNKHSLLSAVVVYADAAPVWRHVGHVRLTMRDLSPRYVEDYVARNWTSIRHSVGGYKIEEEGVRLFSRIEGDYFAILGLPLIELLSYLTMRGTVDG